MGSPSVQQTPPQTVNSTTTNAPPEYLEEDVKYAAQQGRALYESDSPAYFPYSTATPFTPEQDLALGLQTNRAIQGSPTQQAGSDVYNQTLAGDFLGQGNPYMDAAAQSAWSQVRPAVESTFASSGRGGGVGTGAGVAETEAMARGFGNAIAPLAYRNYGQERGIQSQFAANAPQYAQQDYNDINQLGGAGEAYQSQNAAQLQDAMNRFNYQQNLPQQKLNQYQAGLYGSPFGTQTGQQVNPGQQYFQQNGLQQALGVGGQLGSLGMMGASLFSSKDYKTPGTDVDTLDGVKNLKIEKWRYTPDFADSAEHIGPYAEDFQREFKVGDGKTIPLIDYLGVLTRAVQELAEQVEALKRGV